MCQWAATVTWSLRLLGLRLLLLPIHSMQCIHTYYYVCVYMQFSIIIASVDAIGMVRTPASRNTHFQSLQTHKQRSYRLENVVTDTHTHTHTDQVQ